MTVGEIAKNTIAIGQIEDTQIFSQISKQTVRPAETYFFNDREPATGITSRREKIADNHIFLMGAVEDFNYDYVWQLEGDSILPENALEQLIEDYIALKVANKNIGYVSGVQVGRHGIYCYGAWHMDADRKGFRSLNYKSKGVKEVDATGFYCLFAEREVWLNGNATWNGERWGPDVNFGLSLKEFGYKLYADTDLHIGHKTSRGIIQPSDISSCNVEFRKDEHGNWRYKTSY